MIDKIRLRDTAKTMVNLDNVSHIGSIICFEELDGHGDEDMGPYGSFEKYSYINMTFVGRRHCTLFFYKRTKEEIKKSKHALGAVQDMALLAEIWAT